MNIYNNLINFNNEPSFKAANGSKKNACPAQKAVQANNHKSQNSKSKNSNFKNTKIVEPNKKMDIIKKIINDNPWVIKQQTPNVLKELIFFSKGTETDSKKNSLISNHHFMRCASIALYFQAAIHSQKLTHENWSLVKPNRAFAYFSKEYDGVLSSADIKQLQRSHFSPLAYYLIRKGVEIDYLNPDYKIQYKNKSYRVNSLYVSNLTNFLPKSVNDLDNVMETGEFYWPDLKNYGINPLQNLRFLVVDLGNKVVKKEITILKANELVSNFLYHHLFHVKTLINVISTLKHSEDIKGNSTNSSYNLNQEEENILNEFTQLVEKTDLRELIKNLRSLSNRNKNEQYKDLINDKSFINLMEETMQAYHKINADLTDLFWIIEENPALKDFIIKDTNCMNALKLWEELMRSAMLVHDKYGNIEKLFDSFLNKKDNSHLINISNYSMEAIKGCQRFFEEYEKQKDKEKIIINDHVISVVRPLLIT